MFSFATCNCSRVCKNGIYLATFWQFYHLHKTVGKSETEAAELAGLMIGQCLRLEGTIL